MACPTARALSPQPEELPAEDSLPDTVLVSMLRREVLLTKAKLHYSLFEHITQERQLRTWKAQLRQVRRPSPSPSLPASLALPPSPCPPRSAALPLRSLLVMRPRRCCCCCCCHCCCAG